METLQRFAVPLAIVIAGGFIAVALYYSNGSGNTNPGAVTQQQEAVDAPSAIKTDDHVLGSRDAQLMIVEYSDTECPFCKQFHGTLQQVMATYDATEVAWVYRHFPIAQLHQKANREAQATECAYKQGGDAAFWKYLDRIIEITPSNDGLADSELPKIAQYTGVDVAQWQQCLDSGEMQARVDRDYNEVVQAGGRGTPHTVVVSKTKLSKDAKQAISEIPPQLGISLVDDYSVFISGALPLDVVSATLDIMLDKEPQQ